MSSSVWLPSRGAARAPTEGGGGCASVLSVARGAAPVALRPVLRTKRDEAPAAVFGPVPVPEEVTRIGKVGRNLWRLRGTPDGGDLSEVPREEAREVPVDEILYTHDDVSSHFKDGRSIESTVEQLVSGKLDPLLTPFLWLDVVEFEGRLWSIRNRRLCALKSYQRHLRREGSAAEVLVRVFVIGVWQGSAAALYKFLESFSTQDRGQSVEVKPSSRAGLVPQPAAAASTTSPIP